MEKICECCACAHHDGECTVYETPPPMFIRKGACPFNYHAKVTKVKERVGQQKQRKK